MEKNTIIGHRLRNARKTAGRSLADIAADASISISTLSRMETGKQAVEVDTLLTLSSILGVDPGALLSSTNRDEDGSHPLLSQLRILSRSEWTELWKALAEAAATSPPANVLQEEVDELLAQADFLRARIEAVKNRIK